MKLGRRVRPSGSKTLLQVVTREWKISSFQWAPHNCDRRTGSVEKILHFLITMWGNVFSTRAPSPMKEARVVPLPLQTAPPEWCTHSNKRLVIVLILCFPDVQRLEDIVKVAIAPVLVVINSMIILAFVFKIFIHLISVDYCTLKIYCTWWYLSHLLLVSY